MVPLLKIEDAVGKVREDDLCAAVGAEEREHLSSGFYDVGIGTLDLRGVRESGRAGARVRFAVGRDGVIVWKT